MLCFSALVAGSFSLGSQVANDIAPTVINAVRFWLAACLIAGVALTTTHIPRTAFHAPWRYAVLGGLFGLYFVLMFEGLKTAPAVSAAAVFTMTPLIAGGFGWVLLRQVTTRHMAGALILGGIGALWVIFRGDWQAARAFEVGTGEQIYFLGCVAHAIYTPMVRRLNRGEAPVVFTLGTLLGGAVLLTVYGWSDLRAVAWQELPARVWWTIGYLALFATAGSVVALQFAAMRLPSAKVMAYTYLVPSWVIVWQAALGFALPPATVLIGVGVTVLALLLLLMDR